MQIIGGLMLFTFLLALFLALLFGGFYLVATGSIWAGIACFIALAVWGFKAGLSPETEDSGGYLI